MNPYRTAALFTIYNSCLTHSKAAFLNSTWFCPCTIENLMWPKYYGVIYEYHVTDTSCDQSLNIIGQPQYVLFTRATFVKLWSSSNLKSPVHKRYVFKWHKTNEFSIGCLNCAAFCLSGCKASATVLRFCISVMSLWMFVFSSFFLQQCISGYIYRNMQSRKLMI